MVHDYIDRARCEKQAEFDFGLTTQVAHVQA